jgi:hypothetical protein
MEHIKSEELAPRWGRKGNSGGKRVGDRKGAETVRKRRKITPLGA